MSAQPNHFTVTAKETRRVGMGNNIEVFVNTGWTPDPQDDLEGQLHDAIERLRKVATLECDRWEREHS